MSAVRRGEVPPAVRQVSWNRVFVGVAVLFPLWAQLAVLRPMRRAEEPWVVVAVFVGMVGVELMLIASCRSQVVVTEKDVRALVGPARVPVFWKSLNDIETIETTIVSWRDWGGWGLRWKPGELAVLLRSGPAVAITTTAGRRCILTCRDPEAVVLTVLEQSRRSARGV